MAEQPRIVRIQDTDGKYVDLWLVRFEQANHYRVLPSAREAEEYAAAYMYALDHIAPDDDLDELDTE